MAWTSPLNTNKNSFMLLTFFDDKHTTPECNKKGQQRQRIFLTPALDLYDLIGGLSLIIGYRLIEIPVVL